MSRPQNIFDPYHNPKNSPLGLQIVKNYPKIKSNSKVRIERIVENDISSTTWVDLSPKSAH